MHLKKLVLLLPAILSQGCSPVFSLGNPNPTAQCFAPSQTRSNIKHLVIVIQENHSFDSYFANYCKAPVGSNPTCTTGPECCETGPRELGGVAPIILTDAQNVSYDPNHYQNCELDQINGGLMDHYVSGANVPFCSDPQNFAYADATTVSTYWEYARTGALADRYFQPVAGASSSNNMYFARAQFVFADNIFIPRGVGSACYAQGQKATFSGSTIGDLLNSCGVPWAFYAEGYNVTRANPFVCDLYPDGYDASDNPFQYYLSLLDNAAYQKDYLQFSADIAAGTLPAVSFIKALGYRSEHPGSTITDGTKFVAEVVNTVLQSPTYQRNTLILLAQDESGGYYDHVAPPPTSSVDGQAYGARVPFLATGFFAKQNEVSHVVMEHSSVVRFIEWNFFDGEPGQLGTRDLEVNGIGSLLDPDRTGIVVP